MGVGEDEGGGDGVVTVDRATEEKALWDVTTSQRVKSIGNLPG